LGVITILFGVAVLTYMLCVVPIMGFTAGTGHIDEWVIAPTICSPVKAREARLQAPKAEGSSTKEKREAAATCVAVKKTGDDEHRGRVVFATFNAVVLYDPQSGTVRRVSTEGASVEVIAKL